MRVALHVFSEATARWFADTFPDGPTPAQAAGWPAIARGANVLIQAPTGSGKTLAAFLHAIDQLATTPAAGTGIRLLYVSPLKALNYDVERNLRGPLAGIRATAERLGLAPPDISVAVRTGDTPARDRAAAVRRPPDVMITTPESLFLLLTSPNARETLRSVETVIVDEVHAVAATKRGTHLAPQPGAPGAPRRPARAADRALGHAAAAGGDRALRRRRPRGRGGRRRHRQGARARGGRAGRGHGRAARDRAQRPERRPAGQPLHLAGDVPAAAGARRARTARRSSSSTTGASRSAWPCASTSWPARRWHARTTARWPARRGRRSRSS